MGGSSCYELMETNEGKLAYVYLFPMRHRVSCSSSGKFSTGIRAVCVLITASAFSTCHSVIIVSILTLFFFFFFAVKQMRVSGSLREWFLILSDSKVWHLTFMENRSIFCH